MAPIFRFHSERFRAYSSGGMMSARVRAVAVAIVIFPLSPVLLGVDSVSAREHLHRMRNQFGFRPFRALLFHSLRDMHAGERTFGHDEARTGRGRLTSHR